MLRIEATDVEINVHLTTRANGAAEMKEDIFECELDHVLGCGRELCDVGVVHLSADTLLLLLGEGLVLDPVGTEVLLVRNEGWHLGYKH